MLEQTVYLAYLAIPASLVAFGIPASSGTKEELPKHGQICPDAQWNRMWNCGITLLTRGVGGLQIVSRITATRSQVVGVTSGLPSQGCARGGRPLALACPRYFMVYVVSTCQMSC